MRDTCKSERMGWKDLFAVNRAEIAALHKTWFAFFMTFYVWFNMAPLASTIIKDTGLTLDQIKVLAICNVALTVPARVIIGMLSDRIGLMGLEDQGFRRLLRDRDLIKVAVRP